jgi:hypothetical protein
MAKPDNQWQELAAKAAERIDADRAAGVQLSLIPDPAEPRLPEKRATGGRPAGAKNKGSSQLRDWLAAQGLKMPEQQIAEIAGLGARDLDALGTAMAQAERLITWATDGKGELSGKNAASALVALRIDLFKFLYSSILRASDALLPYGTPKASPDVVQNTNVTFVVPSAPSQPGDQARVINPAKAGRMAPPPLPGETVENQDVSDDDPQASDDEDRTE